MCMYYEGREFNSDTARLIHKFDIYFCDLGTLEIQIHLVKQDHA